MRWSSVIARRFPKPPGVENPDAAARDFEDAPIPELGEGSRYFFPDRAELRGELFACRVERYGRASRARRLSQDEGGDTLGGITQ